MHADPVPLAAEQGHGIVEFISPWTAPCHEGKVASEDALVKEEHGTRQGAFAARGALSRVHASI